MLRPKGRPPGFSCHALPSQLLLWPLNGKEFPCLFRRPIATRKMHSIGEHYVTISGQIARRWYHFAIRDNPGVFQTFPVRHQDVRFANVRSIVRWSAVRGVWETMRVKARFHNTSLCPVSDNGCTTL